MTVERAVALVAGLGLLAAAVLASRAASRRFGTVIDPPSVFCAVWGISLTLFAVPWVRYTHTPAAIEA